MKNEINYQIHVPIICGLLIFQFFVMDIFSTIFLYVAENKIAKTTDLIYYKKGQYSPFINKKELWDSTDESRNFEFVTVYHSANTLIETYYTKKAERIRVSYIDGKWKGTETTSFAVYPFLVFPLMGFALIVFAHYHKIFRYGIVNRRIIRSYPNDKVEKFCILYGVTIFLSTIIFGFLGRGP